MSSFYPDVWECTLSRSTKQLKEAMYGSDSVKRIENAKAQLGPKCKAHGATYLIVLDEIIIGFLTKIRNHLAFCRRPPLLVAVGIRFLLNIGNVAEPLPGLLGRAASRFGLSRHRFNKK